MWHGVELCFISAKASLYETLSTKTPASSHAPCPAGETDVRATCPLAPGQHRISGNPASLHGAAVPREEGKAFSQGAASFIFSSSFIILQL